MKRRSFLRHAFHAAAAPSIISSLGFTSTTSKSMQYFLRQAAQTDKALVMIYLDGGNDGLNTVVPLDRISELNRVRPRVVLPESSLIPLRESSVGLHPSLQGFSELYSESKLQIIQNVGYPDPDFSHFRSTDIWASASDSSEVVNSGWIGRHLENSFPGYPEAFPSADMPDPLSIELGAGSSLLFQGVASATNFTLQDANSFYELLDNVEQEAPNTPAGDKLRFIRLISRQSQQYGQQVRSVAEKVNQHVAYPESELADQLKIISKLIAGGSKTPVYLVRLRGFDTHDSQVADDHQTGEHADLLRTLDQAVAAFTKDLDFHNVGDKVLGMTFSEFGRTILSNASNGTDHGTAAPMFFFGNSVTGGVVGNNPVIDGQMTYADNLPHEYDFRQLYNSVLEQWFGIEKDSRNNVLLGDFEPVKIIGDPSITLSIKSDFDLSVYPNPMTEQVQVRFDGDGSNVKISLIDLQGKLIAQLYQGASHSGVNTISCSTTGVPSGRYFTVLASKSGKQVFSVVK